MSASPTRGSAAWVTAIVAVMMFIVGAFILTVVDPVLQTLFASSIFESTTVPGTNTLRHSGNFWGFWPVALLIAILTTVWIKTRRAG